MDIAYYLSELLEQLGEVNVPGLGSFTRVKVDGYYNSDEGRFYPPASKIEFSRHYIEDDELARYIGVKKRISLASSKYFTEKYLDGLREEIMSKAIALADIGLLYFENGEIRFKAAEALPDPTFFGYPKITLNKLGDEPVITDTIPVAEPEREPEPEVAEEIEQQAEEGHQEIVADTLPTLLEEQVIVYGGGQEAHSIEEEVLEAEEIAPIEDYEILDDDGGHEGHGIHEQYERFRSDLVEKEIPVFEDDTDFIQHNLRPEEEEEQHRSYKWLWITLILLAVAGGGVFCWYYSQQMQEPKVEKKTAPVLSTDTADSARSADSIKNLPVGDTGNKAAANLPPQNSLVSTIDSSKVRYEVVGVKVGTLKEVKKVLRNYESIGINAHLVARRDIRGPLYKISLGTYLTEAQALIARDSLLKTRKVRKDIQIYTINPKK